MDVNRTNQSVYKKRKRRHGDEEDMSKGSMDSYSDRSLESEPDEFLNIKKEYLKRKKNLNRDCCRETLDCHENYFLTGSTWLRLAQRSSVPKFDSDLFCSEKLMSWDWLRESQLLNSILTQTCYTQKIFDPNFGSLS